MAILKNKNMEHKETLLEWAEGLMSDDFYPFLKFSKEEGYTEDDKLSSNEFLSLEKKFRESLNSQWKSQHYFCWFFTKFDNYLLSLF